MRDCLDVVIVGAGLSGLSSALHLVDLGLSSDKITIVEGRGRVGGRLEASQGVDVGGAWSWVSAHPDVPALARRFGVTPFPQYDQGLHVLDYGRRKAATRTRQPLDSARLRFDGGASSLTRALADHLRAKGVKLILDCVVDRVCTADADAVVVEGVEAGTRRYWRAKALFLALPPRLMLPPLISWEPTLPTEIADAAKETPTWMADTTKVLVTYQRPFWREQGFSGSAMSYGGEGPIRQLYDSCGAPEGNGPYALCGFIFGAGADLPSDDILRPQVLEQLERMFGTDAKSVLTFSTHRWGEQALTSGNGGSKDGGHDDMGDAALRIPFGAPLDGGHPRIWLSGAETDARHAGLMEGALLSGRRVVEQAFHVGPLAPQQEVSAADEKAA